MKIDDFPPEYQQQIRRKIGVPARPAVQAADTPSMIPRPKRGQGRKLNKTEVRCFEELKRTHPDWLIISQGLRLDFDDGTSYNPDFVLMCPALSALGVLVVECKGGHVGKVAWSRIGLERYRRAKERWGEWLDFQMWTWSLGKWEIT
jgi:hypothetical protein